MPGADYYHRQADLCLGMALSASEYEEHIRLLDIANGYRDSAARIEGLKELDSLGPREGLALALFTRTSSPKNGGKPTLRASPGLPGRDGGLAAAALPVNDADMLGHVNASSRIFSKPAYFSRCWRRGWKIRTHTPSCCVPRRLFPAI
jgi:hypothetical protein